MEFCYPGAAARDGVAVEGNAPGRHGPQRRRGIHRRGGCGSGRSLYRALYHGSYELDGPEAVDALPGGHEWRASVEAVGEDVRHLEIHRGHLTYLNEHDEAAWAAGSWQLLGEFTLTGSRDEIRGRIDELERQGVTELAYQPRRAGLPFCPRRDSRRLRCRGCVDLATAGAE